MDELLGSALAPTGGDDRTRPTSWRPENVASRMEARVPRVPHGRRLRGAWPTPTPRMSVSIDMRPLLLSQVVGRDAYVEHSKLIVQLGMTRMDAEDLMVRGEHLVLTHLDWGDRGR